MDRKAIVAVGLCVLLLVLWRPLIKQLGYGRYVEAPRPVPVTAVDTTSHDASAPTPIAAAPESAVVSPGRLPGPVPERRAPVLSGPAIPTVAAIEQTTQIETPLYRATFTNHGARLLSVELKHFAAARGVSAAGGGSSERGEEVPPGDRVVLAGGPLFGLDIGSGADLVSLGELTYTVAESLGADGQRRVVSFTAQQDGLHIRQTYRVRPDDYALDLQVEIRELPASWRVSDYSLTARSWPLLTDADLASEARSLRSTSLVGTNFHSDHAGGLLKGPKAHDGNVMWAAVQTRYFIGAVVIGQSSPRRVLASAERRPLGPQELRQLPPNTRAEQDVAVTSMVLGLPPASSPVHRFVIYAGPCEYFRLSKLDLERAVDLGWNWVRPFSSALLWLLSRLYGLVHNYGIAIVALATLVRVLLHPLNMMSMKSMRAMQKLQPEMERIREKFKSDPQAMNAAVMALYKDNKVNPAGGCLPMLLQMPLFIALYQVLYNAIELRQAGFMLWMNDLSAPDHLFSIGPFPVRLLPILMLGSGLLSQRLTPTDPRQLTTMYMMNVVMLVFFYNLPSGLVLYWTVMNLLTALQQWMILRQDGPAPVKAPAAVPAHAGGKKRRAATKA